MVNHQNLKQALASVDAHINQSMNFASPVARHGADEHMRDWTTTAQARALCLP